MAPPPPARVLGGGGRLLLGGVDPLGLGFEVGASDPSTSMVKELLYAAVGCLVVLPVALAGATLPRSLRWLGSRPMVVLGVLSYGIYLWHEGVLDIYRDIRDLPVFTGLASPPRCWSRSPAAWPRPRCRTSWSSGRR